MKALLGLSIVSLIFMVRPSGADDQRAQCAVAVLKVYNQAMLAIEAQFPVPMSIEGLVARRRLQETYCMRWTRCSVDSAPDSMPFRMLLASCLRDEEREDTAD